MRDFGDNLPRCGGAGSKQYIQVAQHSEKKLNECQLISLQQLTEIPGWYWSRNAMKRGTIILANVSDDSTLHKGTLRS